MKRLKIRLIYPFLAIFILSACSQEKQTSSANPVNWRKKEVKNLCVDNLIKGHSYLSVYPQIYQQHEHKTYDLTVTVSLRNVQPNDTVYILSADYFNTAGKKIRNYIKDPICLRPLETIEIVIGEGEKEGGTGANFMFEWAVAKKGEEPLFEAVMISTTGQQGLSFITKGIKIVE